MVLECFMGSVINGLRGFGISGQSGWNDQGGQVGLYG